MGKSSSTEIEVYGINMGVDYYYDEGEDMVMYYPDGSGYPGSPPSVDIEGVYVDGETNIYDLLCENVIDRIQEIIIESYE